MTSTSRSIVPSTLAPGIEAYYKVKREGARSRAECIAALKALGYDLSKLPKVEECWWHYDHFLRPNDPIHADIETTTAKSKDIGIEIQPFNHIPRHLTPLWAATYGLAVYTPTTDCPPSVKKGKTRGPACDLWPSEGECRGHAGALPGFFYHFPKGGPGEDFECANATSKGFPTLFWTWTKDGYLDRCWTCVQTGKGACDFAAKDRKLVPLKDRTLFYAMVRKSRQRVEFAPNAKYWRPVEGDDEEEDEEEDESGEPSAPQNPPDYYVCPGMETDDEASPPQAPSPVDDQPNLEVAAPLIPTKAPRRPQKAPTPVVTTPETVAPRFTRSRLLQPALPAGSSKPSAKSKTPAPSSSKTSAGAGQSSTTRKLPVRTPGAGAMSSPLSQLPATPRAGPTWASVTSASKAQPLAVSPTTSPTTKRRGRRHFSPATKLRKRKALENLGIVGKQPGAEEVDELEEDTDDRSFFDLSKKKRKFPQQSKAPASTSNKRPHLAPSRPDPPAKDLEAAHAAGNDFEAGGVEIDYDAGEPSTSGPSASLLPPFAMDSNSAPIPPVTPGSVLTTGITPGQQQELPSPPQTALQILASSASASRQAPVPATIPSVQPRSGALPLILALHEKSAQSIAQMTREDLCSGNTLHGQHSAELGKHLRAAKEALGHWESYSALLSEKQSALAKTLVSETKQAASRVKALEDPLSAARADLRASEELAARQLKALNQANERVAKADELKAEQIASVQTQCRDAQLAQEFAERRYLTLVEERQKLGQELEAVKGERDVALQEASELRNKLAAAEAENAQLARRSTLVEGIVAAPRETVAPSPARRERASSAGPIGRSQSYDAVIRRVDAERDRCLASLNRLWNTDAGIKAQAETNEQASAESLAPEESHRSDGGSVALPSSRESEEPM